MGDHESALSQENMRATYIRYNSDFSSKLGETISVKEIYIYPRYNSKSLNHNLAILRLQTNFKSSRILLDRGSLNVPPNVEIKILGWGAKERDVEGPGIIDNLLYGVISFGAPVCGDPSTPTVFTRVGL